MVSQWSETMIQPDIYTVGLQFSPLIDCNFWKHVMPLDVQMDIRRFIQLHILQIILTFSTFLSLQLKKNNLERIIYWELFCWYNVVTKNRVLGVLHNFQLVCSLKRYFQFTTWMLLNDPLRIMCFCVWIIWLVHILNHLIELPSTLHMTGTMFSRWSVQWSGKQKEKCLLLWNMSCWPCKFWGRGEEKHNHH